MLHGGPLAFWSQTIPMPDRADPGLRKREDLKLMASKFLVQQTPMDAENLGGFTFVTSSLLQSALEHRLFY